jgi:RND family efflux transporter MFP subunit
VPAVVHVHAPIDGTVLTSHATPGHAVEPGGELYTIADLDTVWGQVDVFEKDLARASVGARVSLAVAAYPGDRFPGEVTLVSSVMDEATRTVKVRVEVPNPRRRLRPGMFLAATIAEGAARERVAVPAPAIQEDGEGRYVFIAEGGGRFRQQAVAVGAQDSGYVEVESGLEPGVEVVTDGAFVLKSELLKSGFEAE